MKPDDVRDWLLRFVLAESFYCKYPYYAAILARLAPVYDPSVHAMAVSFQRDRFFLHVNPSYFEGERAAMRSGILLHEVHHIVLGHLTDPRFRDVDAPELMDLAVEMSANEYIEEPLPNPITWQAFAPLGIRAGQSTLVRYEKLRAAANAVPKHVRSNRTVDDHRPMRTTAPHPGAREHARRLVEEAIEAADLEARERGEPLAQDVAKLAGASPGELLERLSGALGKPRDFVDWRRAILPTVMQARAPKHVYGRPNRRFPHRRDVPGRAWIGRTATRPHLLVAIDTSMSMSRAELEEVSRHLAELGELAQITIAECDVVVQRLYPFTGALPEVAGRGGTDLRAPFAPEVLARVRPDAIVYFTDGQGPYPESPPASPLPIPTLWVLTRPEAFACPWGGRAVLGRAGTRGAR